MFLRRDLGVPPRRGVPPRSRNSTETRCSAEISVFRRDACSAEISVFRRDVVFRRDLSVLPRSRCSAETQCSTEISVFRRDAVFRRDLGVIPRRGPLVMTIVQELCESRGGRPGLSVLTSLLVSVDVKIYCTVLRHWSQLVPNMSHDI